jgi:GTP cyclohydrolase II
MPPSQKDGRVFCFGDPEQIGAERGIAEIRAARPILVLDGEQRFVVLPVDGLDEDRLSLFMASSAPVSPRLAITARRARSIGIDASGPVTLKLGDGRIDAIQSLVCDVRTGTSHDVAPAGTVLQSALDLAKLAQRLPAVLAVEAPPTPVSFDPPLVSVSAQAVARFRHITSRSLKIATEANVPLEGGVQSRFVIFRDVVGNDSVAVVVGRPDFSGSVPVRLHSACLTGDVFGSRRCDCGDQLRLALTELASAGGGIILYLDQEGRGLGLANKMRTYRLQEAGFDTVDANISLGFDDDERDYEVAGRMLELLGCRSVQLFTNNPGKISGLRSAGIEISERIPLFGSVNGDNRRYLTAKATRNGHSFGHLLETLTAAADPARLVAADDAADRPPPIR